MADLGTKISELEAAAALDGTELLVAVQGGRTKKSTAAAVETLVKTGLTASDVGLGNVANERQYSAQNPPPTPTPAEIGAVPTNRTVNGKALSTDITLVASDVGAEESLTWDNVPTAGSVNPVKSGGIYDALLALLPTDTVSGNPASFPDGADDVPVVDLKVSIEPVQEGSGDPSPDNVRPISGWTGMTLYHSGADTSDPETVSVSWQAEAGTVYGGTLDVTTGLLTVEWTKLVLDGVNNQMDGSAGSGSSTLPAKTGVQNISSDNSPISDKLKAVSNAHIYGTQSAFNLRPESGMLIINVAGIKGVGPGEAYATVGELRSAANDYLSNNNIAIVYKLATPVTYQLTPTEVKTLLGENNIWADCGPVEAEYRADLEKYIEKKIGDVQALILENI